MNAAGVLQVPMAMSVWDDGYGISVPKEFQTIKGNISEALSGFEAKNGGKGLKGVALKNKNYTIYEVNFQLNIVAFRSKNQVKDEENSNVTNLFDEEIGLLLPEVKLK